MKWPSDKSAIRETYEANGFVVLNSLFGDQEVADIRANLQRYIDEVVPALPPMDVFYEDKDTKNDIRMLPRMDHHDAFFEKMLSEAPLREIAEFLWGCAACPRDAAYFNKPALIGEATPPHQDGYYFHLDPCEALTMWLALDEVDEENGCVRYVRGSQRDGMRPHARTKVLGFSQGITDFGTDAELRNEVPVCVSPGALIVHDALTIHRAGPNKSARSRRAMGFVYFSSRAKVDQAASDRYQAELAQELTNTGKI